MRKLILTSFQFKTGEFTHTENRLIVVDQNINDKEQDLLDKAVDHVKSWFVNFYPESELIYIIPHPTIGDDSTADPKIEVFTRRALVEFGEFLLSEKRKHLILYTPSDIPDRERLNQVYHSDVENWLAK